MLYLLIKLTHNSKGAAAAAAFDAEDAFDIIQVFERRETAGGTWYDPLLSSLCGVLIDIGYTTKIRHHQISSIPEEILQISILR